MKKKRILVIGASGFLGRFLIPKLRKNFIVDITNSSKNNLLKDGSLKEFNNKKYFEIFHLAAWTQAGDFCLKFPGDQWIRNQKINTNVLSWWKEYQPNAKMIFIGTSCSYPTNMILEEKNYLKGEPIESLYTYAMTKRMLLAGAKSFSKQYNLNWVSYIPSTLYGPYYHDDERQMHFIFDLIKKILLGKYKSKKVILWGNGYQKREIIHVNDFVNIMLKTKKKLKNEVINIGSGKGYSIREFAKIICDIVGYDFKKIKFDTSKYIGAKSKILCVKKITKTLKNYPKHLINIKLGIKETIDWFIRTKKI
jgi:GDP-L-fucose synthase